MLLHMDLPISLFLFTSSTASALPWLTVHQNLQSVQVIESFSISQPALPVYPVKCFDPASSQGRRRNPGLKKLIEDCNYILNEMILRLEDVFTETTFHFPGYETPTDHKAQSRWTHGQCIIFVSAIEPLDAARMSLYDVALTANKILSECVISTSKILGGSSLIGPPNQSSYVSLMPKSTGGHVVEISSETFLPNTMISRRTLWPQPSPESSIDSQTLEAREPPAGPDFSLSLTNITSSIRASPENTIHCFLPGQFRLERAIASDCDVVINEIILRLENPMNVQTFGFNESADVDLSLPGNQKWYYEQCLITVDSMDRTQQAHFRPLDVAIAAQRIMHQCVIESKDALGGTAPIGDPDVDFYITVGGIRRSSVSATDTKLLLPSNGIKERSILEAGAEVPRFRIRSDNISKQTFSATFAPPISCFKPGMPAARSKIGANDCTAVAKTILDNPNVLFAVEFTTEPTGGFQVPYVRHENSCYLMVDTNAEYSRTDAFSWLKVVFFASEVMKKCPLGGVAKISSDSNGFFVSVTGVSPTPLEGESVEMLDSKRSGIILGDSSSQTASIGTS